MVPKKSSNPPTPTRTVCHNSEMCSNHCSRACACDTIPNYMQRFNLMPFLLQHKLRLNIRRYSFNFNFPLTIVNRNKTFTQKTSALWLKKKYSMSNVSESERRVLYMLNHTHDQSKYTHVSHKIQRAIAPRNICIIWMKREWLYNSVQLIQWIYSLPFALFDSYDIIDYEYLDYNTYTDFRLYSYRRAAKTITRNPPYEFQWLLDCI